MKIAIVVVLLLSVQLALGSEVMPIELFILPQGRVQFDNGPILSEKLLRAELRKLIEKKDCRPILLRPFRNAPFEVVYPVYSTIQHYGCNQVGFLDALHEY